jgi:hypothetical protein
LVGYQGKDVIGIWLIMSLVKFGWRDVVGLLHVARLWLN